eukprot:8876585-Pyramimonas_sp.AAC.1
MLVDLLRLVVAVSLLIKVRGNNALQDESGGTSGLSRGVAVRLTQYLMETWWSSFTSIGWCSTMLVMACARVRGSSGPLT